MTDCKQIGDDSASSDFFQGCLRQLWAFSPTSMVLELNSVIEPLKKGTGLK